jgi:hypothetical protein
MLTRCYKPHSGYWLGTSLVRHRTLESRNQLWVERNVGRRQTNRLTPMTVNAKKAKGYYADGNGLYLQVSESISKSWIFRYSLNKRAREMGLGSTADRTLAEARGQRDKFRKLLDEGIDPIAYRQTERARNIQATAQRLTFAECAKEYHKLRAGTWKNAKHADQWINTLTSYAFPEFGAKEVSEVSKADVVRVLEPIWISKAETASRLRQRIRAILDWAAARDYRIGHDPHMWDQVARSLPKTKDVKRVKHFAACPYSDIYETVRSIKSSGASDMVKLAMEFAILNASRSGEVRLARKAEIDFDGNRNSRRQNEVRQGASRAVV